MRRMATTPARRSLQVLGVAAAVALAAAGGGGGEEPALPADRPARGQAVARQFCTSCHAFPPPDILPRNKWNSTIFEMVGFAVTGTGAPKGKLISVDVPVEEIVAYYESEAPRELPPPVAWPEPSNTPVAFARRPMTLKGGAGSPAVANVRLFTMKAEVGLEVIAADMSNGLILRGSPARPEAGLEVLGRVSNPSHTEAVDLDRDGTMDLVVANLGSVTPGD